jgi:hypothetical protein
MLAAFTLFRVLLTLAGDNFGARRSISSFGFQCSLMDGQRCFFGVRWRPV